MHNGEARVVTISGQGVKDRVGKRFGSAAARSITG